MLWTLSQIAELTHARLDGDDRQIFHVTQDSREVRDGSLFVPLKAARDGHEFASLAHEAGAAGSFWASNQQGPEGLSLIHVDDGLRALQMLGAAAAKRHRGRRIAITGSVGKTTTKDMLAHILSHHHVLHAARNSFNNHIGVPLTLANMAADAEIGVFELGMSNAGEIAPLSRMVAPHIAMVTAIAPAHIAQLGSLEAIAREKASIFEGLGGEGLALVPDDAEYSELIEQEACKHAQKVVRFGSKPTADYVCSLAQVNELGMHLHVKGPTNSGEINVGFVAPQLCGSIAASYAISECLGMTFSDFAAAMASFALPAGRGRLVRMDRPVPFSLLDDSYNANPSSMRAAIDALGLHHGRKLVVLGDMLELGEHEEAAHQEVVHRIIEIGVDVVVAVGPAMSQAFEAKKLPNKVICVDSIDDALAAVCDLVQPSDLVLAKGSHGSGIYRIVAQLLDGGQDGVATT